MKDGRTSWNKRCMDTYGYQHTKTLMSWERGDGADMREMRAKCLECMSLIMLVADEVYNREEWNLKLTLGRGRW